MKLSKLILAIGITIISLAVIGIAYFSYQRKNAPKEFTFERISFSYPQDYEEEKLAPPQANQAKTILKLKIVTPLSYIEFAKEEGAIIGANLTKTNFLDYLEKNAEKGFPATYPSYQKIKSERLEISGYDATIISFSYLGQDEKTTVYLNFFIIPLNNDAYYLTLQSVDQKKLETDTNTIRKTLQIN